MWGTGRILKTSISRIGLFIIFAVLFAGSTKEISAKFKVIVPDKSDINLGTLVQKEGELDIGDFINSAGLNKRNILGIRSVEGAPELFFLVLNDRALVIDQEKRKVVQRFELDFVERIIDFKSLKSFLVIHNKKEGKKSKKNISCFQKGETKAKWSIPFDFVFGYGYSYGNVYNRYSFPGKFRYFPDSKTIFFTGISKYSKKENARRLGYIINKLIFINAENGNVISEHEYSYRREILGSSAELFVDVLKKKFNLIDLKTGKIVETIKYDDSILPEKPARYFFIDLNRGRGRSMIGREWEFSALNAEKGLIISARKMVMRFKMGVKESYWSIFDKNKKQWEKIDQAPLGGFDMAIRNISGKLWPVIVPHIVYQSGFRKWKSVSYWQVNPDGSMKKYNAPESNPEKKIYFTFNAFGNRHWVHDSQYLYLMSSRPPKLFKKYVPDSKLFRFKIGSTEKELIHQCGKDEPFDTIYAGFINYLVLSQGTGLTNRAVFKIPEGEKVPESEYSKHKDLFLKRFVLEKKYFDLWKKLLNPRHLKKNIQKNGLPGKFKKFLCTLPLRMNYLNLIPTIWSKFENYVNNEDIGIIPLRLSDKSVVISGINIITEKVEFYIPILNINNSRYPRRTLILNNKEALVTVLEDYSTLKFYKIKRPGSFN